MNRATEPATQRVIVRMIILRLDEDSEVWSSGTRSILRRKQGSR